MVNDKNFLLDLDSINIRFENLIYRVRYKKWFDTIIKYEKLDIKVKNNQNIHNYYEQFFNLINGKKEKILKNWEFGCQPVIQTNWIEEKIDVNEIQNIFREKRGVLEKDLNIYLIRSEQQIKSIDCCFLGIKPVTYQFIKGRLKKTQPTYYIYLSYSQNSNIIQFRCPESIGKFKRFLFNSINKNYQNTELELNKIQIMSLANEAFARNAKIQCEGEDINERGLAVPENKDLFSISEFINLIKKENYIIRKIFVSLHLKDLKAPYNLISLRIFPSQGKFSFTGLVNEEQIRETFKIIQKVRTTTPIKGRNKLMDEFL